MRVGTRAEVCIHTHAHTWTHTQRRESTCAHAQLRCVHTHTQERALSGGSGRGWAHRAPIRRAGGTPHALTEGRVWRKVLPEGAWRRRWHWSAPGHSWPSCRCPEFLQQAGVTLGPGSPQAGRPVWQTPFLGAGLGRVSSGLPSQTRRRASRLWPVPVLDTVSHSSCWLQTPRHSFPCSLVGSPALWLGLVLPAHWLVPPGPGLPPWPPSAPPPGVWPAAPVHSSCSPLIPDMDLTACVRPGGQQRISLPIHQHHSSRQQADPPYGHQS